MQIAHYVQLKRKAEESIRYKFKSVPYRNLDLSWCIFRLFRIINKLHFFRIKWADSQKRRDLAFSNFGALADTSCFEHAMDANCHGYVLPNGEDMR